VSPEIVPCSVLMDGPLSAIESSLPVFKIAIGDKVPTGNKGFIAD
jgi:hypothetical protein